MPIIHPNLLLLFVISPAIYFLKFATEAVEVSAEVRRSLVDAGVLFLLVSVVDLLRLRPCTFGLVFTGEEDFSLPLFEATVNTLFLSVQNNEGFRTERIHWWTIILHRAVIALLGEDADYCRPREMLLEILEYGSEFAYRFQAAY